MRPTERPIKPYTPTQILNHVETHFLVENNPRCTSINGYGDVVCVYTGTGCAVGCLLTIEDAEIIDPDKNLSVEGWYTSDNETRKKIWNTYFGTGPENKFILRALQNAHDRHRTSTDEILFRQNIMDAIDTMREAIALL
jgi:hypothetical protein